MLPHSQQPELVVLSQVNDQLPILVFLPGMDGSDLSLKNHFESLTDTFEVRCFCIPSNDLTDWNGLVHRVVEPLMAEKKSRPDRSIYLCGESFGGCLALETISRHPDLFDRLILINPASSFNRRRWRSLGSVVLRWIPGTTYRVGAVGLLPFMVSSRRVAKPRRQALRRAMQSVTPKSVVWRLSLLRDFRLEPTKLNRFESPTLLVATTVDRLLPSMYEAKRLANHLPQSQVFRLDGSGHACLLEKDISLYELLDQTQFLPNIAFEPAEAS